MLRRLVLPALLPALLAGFIAADVPEGRRQSASAPVVFNRDILPILSENCFLCHGPDRKNRKAKLRLDSETDAGRVIVPGKSADSELYRRITTSDANERMPPSRAKRALSAHQKQLLRQWIDEGGHWGKHWAYEPPRRPPLPAVKNASWCRNDIDRFVLARLEKEGLKPAPEASREMLIRRLALDLTGLPPGPEEIDLFLADTSALAYEKLVDRLLASPHYGERMALDWLDAARFADTNGFQNDFERTMWPWRDWVIKAFNQNMPFDRFVVEQIAGDMLAGAGLDERIATGFNRNNRTVTEAGSIDEEWRVENTVDRVETTSTVLMGLTMGCARCHDHKYDPVSQREFYRFFAFFNSINEKGVYTEQRGNVPPLVQVPSPADNQRLQELSRAMAMADKAVKATLANMDAEQEKWERIDARRSNATEPPGLALRFPLDGRLAMLGASAAETGKADMNGVPAWTDFLGDKALLLQGRPDSFISAGPAIRFERTGEFSYGGWIKPEGDGAILSKMDDAMAYRGLDMLLLNGKIEVHLVNTWPANAVKVSTKEDVPKGIWSHVLASHDGSSKAAGVKIYINGQAVPLQVHKDALTATISTTQALRLGKRSTGFAFKGALADIRFYSRSLPEKDVQQLVESKYLSIVKVPRASRSDEAKQALRRFFRMNFAPLRQAEQLTARLHKDKADYEQKVPTTMVMEDLAQPRPTYLLKRGRYDMPQQTETLKPGVPSCLPPLPANAPGNRLGLARWLVAPANPLTARVTVNRVWQHYFGAGLVKTAENFGIQGEMPLHPELLDWLAVEFMSPSREKAAWDLKALQKLIVTSATYRQTSKAEPELISRDPENRLLARGSRFRLRAELVRDSALAISGLLAHKVGGPSIKPYQPEGLWDELAGGAASKYVQDQGTDLYRRSLYIYRKRTVPHPVLSTFDAPSREVCQVRQQRTDTPLQALALLNDVTYVEAARALAQQLLTRPAQKTAEQRLAYAFRRATARRPEPAELALLTRALDHYLNFYRSDVKEAERLVRHGTMPLLDNRDAAELAAYTAVAGIILNLDETITRE